MFRSRLTAQTGHRPSSRWRRSSIFLLAALSALAVVGAACRPLPGGGGNPSKPLPTVVLVHGAFADASGFNEVTANLQKQGYKVIAPANPLRSLDGDSAYLRSILSQIDGPIVLVGHSYGGMVISNAATGNPAVKALVYIAAFAPDVGESTGGLSALNPGTGLTPENLIIRPYPGGADGYINPTVFRSVFAADVPAKTAAIMASSQRPSDLGVLEQHSAEPAWKTIPSWYMVAKQDKTIPPATERFMAQRAGASTVEINASHVAMVSHPREVTNLIVDAANATS